MTLNLLETVWQDEGEIVGKYIMHWLTGREIGQNNKDYSKGRFFLIDLNFWTEECHMQRHNIKSVILIEKSSLYLHE